MGDKPWDDSLWMDCLFELMAEARKEGKKNVEFADVDKLVVVKSHSISKYEMIRDGKG